jgi:hypothetical protein
MHPHLGPDTENSASQFGRRLAAILRLDMQSPRLVDDIDLVLAAGSVEQTALGAPSCLEAGRRRPLLHRMKAAWATSSPPSPARAPGAITKTNGRYPDFADSTPENAKSG